MDRIIELALGMIRAIGMIVGEEIFRGNLRSNTGQN